MPHFIIFFNSSFISTVMEFKKSDPWIYKKEKKNMIKLAFID